MNILFFVSLNISQNNTDTMSNSQTLIPGSHQRHLQMENSEIKINLTTVCFI